MLGKQTQYTPHGYEIRKCTHSTLLDCFSTIIFYKFKRLKQWFKILACRLSILFSYTGASTCMYSWHYFLDITPNEHTQRRPARSRDVTCPLFKKLQCNRLTCHNIMSFMLPSSSVPIVAAAQQVTSLLDISMQLETTFV